MARNAHPALVARVARVTLSALLPLAVATTPALAADAKATAQPGKLAPLEAPIKWVEAPSKPSGSGIRLRYSVPDVIQAGQLVPVQIELANVRPGAEVQWRLPGGSTGTTMPGGAGSFMALTPGQPNVITVNVMPTADGTVYLDVFTRQNGRGSAQSVPLKVGSGKVTLKQEGVARTGPGGEKVISLPSTPR